MTKKDYEHAASLFRHMRGHFVQETATIVIEFMVMFFTEDSKRFDADRFRKACWQEKP